MPKEKAVKKPARKPAPKASHKKAEAVETAEVKVAPAAEAKTPATGLKYLYAVGRRKSAIAQVRVYPNGKGSILVNNKDWKIYFPTFEYQSVILAPLKLAGQDDKVDITVRAVGGGKRGQSDAIRHGISKALLLMDLAYRKPLKTAGFLTRDSRVKERNKPGLLGARRAPQWAKR
jgi:small subunit ribosomal protein S9